MARENTITAGTNITPSEYEVLKQLAKPEGIAAYLRRLIAEDAERRGGVWPHETIARGKYQRDCPPPSPAPAGFRLPHDRHRQTTG